MTKGIKNGRIKLLYDRMDVVLRDAEVMNMTLRYTLSEISELVGVFRDALLGADVIRDGGGYYIFNGMYYEKMEWQELCCTCELLLESYGVFSRFWNDISYKAIHALVQCSVDGGGGSYICFPNGVVDLMDIQANGRFKLLKHSPDYYVFYCMPYDYDPKAVCPVFVDFLGEVVPDEDMRMNLQEMCGCIFLDRNIHKVEKMAILWGNGGNGKSTFADAVMGALGENNVSNFDLKDLTRGGDRAYNIEAIDGKLLNYCTEITSRSINNANVKSIISREPQTCRAIYGKPKTAYRMPMIFGNVNELPKLDNSFKAYARRIVIYPFDVVIPKDRMDISLSHRMLAERAGILNWMLAGLKRLKDNNYVFTESEYMSRVMRDFVSGAISGDPVARFIYESRWSPKPTEADPDGRRVEFGYIYTLYKEWCATNGEVVFPYNNMARVFSNMGFVKGRSSNKETYYYIFTEEECENEG